MGSRFALIIEDSMPLGMIYSEALQMAEFESEHLTDGREALEKLKDVVPDLIVLDMNLPHVSGHYILKQIRSDARLAEIPVIIATANAPLVEALSKQLSEFDTLLLKPVSARELRDLANSLFPNE